MSAMKCSKCGGETNTAVCDWRPKDKVVVECYAKVEDGVWIKGCGYANCDPFTVEGVDALLGKHAYPSKLHVERQKDGDGKESEPAGDKKDP